MHDRSRRIHQLRQRDDLDLFGERVALRAGTAMALGAVAGRDVLVEAWSAAAAISAGKEDLLHIPNYPAADAVSPRDFIATVYHALGVSETQTVPDLKGRPQFVRPGRAIGQLLA